MIVEKTKLDKVLLIKLEGIHGDDCTWKLISCLHGKFYLVVVNYDEQSKDFRKWESFVLSDRNKHQRILPATADYWKLHEQTPS